MIEPGARRWYFPVAPVVQLQAVEVMSEGVTSTLELDQMQLEAGHDEPRMVFAHGVLPVQSRRTFARSGLCGSGGRIPAHGFAAGDLSDCQGMV